MKEMASGAMITDVVEVDILNKQLIFNPYSYKIMFKILLIPIKLLDFHILINLDKTSLKQMVYQKRIWSL